MTQRNVDVTTLGKYRHLSHCATEAGHFVVLAIDHRTNLREAVDKHADQPVSDAQFLAFKQQIIDNAGDRISAVLTDPAFGIGAGIARRAIRGQVGLLAPLEVTDYNLHPSQRLIEYIPDWSVAKIKRCGGDGVKLLLPYHPDADNAAEKHLTVQHIVAECAAYDIPFFLEPIPYSLDPAQKLSSAELCQLTVQMAHTFSMMGVDVLKLQFPAEGGDEAEWSTACAAVTAACGADVPWALLSGGVDYATFLRQAKTACASGASGVIVGRAVWNEAIQLRGEALARFLRVTIRQRMSELAAICAEHATAWYERTPEPSSALDWYAG